MRKKLYVLVHVKFYFISRGRTSIHLAYMHVQWKCIFGKIKKFSSVLPSRSPSSTRGRTPAPSDMNLFGTWSSGYSSIARAHIQVKCYSS